MDVDPPPPNCWEATPTTALHNVIDYPNKNEHFAACKMVFANPTKSVICWVFDDLRCSLTARDSIVLVPADNDSNCLDWRSHDVARGRVAGNPAHFLTQKHLSFEQISDIWNSITVSVKIGIIVFRNFDINVSNTSASMSEDTLKKLFGEKDSVCVFTGEITKLHINNNTARSFEHSINTYRGCLGAIIFLLDKGQPTAEIEHHKGKAIGVHAGGKPLGARPPPANIGFFL